MLENPDSIKERDGFEKPEKKEESNGKKRAPNIESTMVVRMWCSPGRYLPAGYLDTKVKDSVENVVTRPILHDGMSLQSSQWCIRALSTELYGKGSPGQKGDAWALFIASQGRREIA